MSAKLLITIDEGRAEHHDAAKALRDAGLRAAFFVPAGRIGYPGFMSWPAVGSLPGMGHFVGSCGVEHPWLGRGPSKAGHRPQPPENVTADLLAGRDALAEHGIDTGGFAAVPFGTWNIAGPEHLEAIFAAGMEWLRLTIGAPTDRNHGYWIISGNKRLYPGDYRGRLIGLSASADGRHAYEIREKLRDAADFDRLCVLQYGDITSVTDNSQGLQWERFVVDTKLIASLAERGSLECVLPPDVLPEEKG